MMETYSVLFRGFIKLSKNLLAFTTHWIANTNKTKCQTFIYLFEKKYISYDSYMFRVFITIFWCCLLSYRRDSKVFYCHTVMTVILETAVPCLYILLILRYIRTGNKILNQMERTFLLTRPQKLNVKLNLKAFSVLIIEIHGLVIAQ